MPGQREPHCFVDMWSHGACVVAVAGNARHAAADVGSVGDDDRQTLAVAAAGPCREGRRGGRRIWALATAAGGVTLAVTAWQVGTCETRGRSDSSASISIPIRLGNTPVRT